MTTMNAAVKLSFTAEGFFGSKLSDGMGRIIDRFIGQEPVATVNVTVAGTARASQYRVIENHPLAPLSGMFADDPLWPEYLQAITQVRQEDDALENR